MTRKGMAKPPESDEFVRDVIAAHLCEGEELLWAGRPRQGTLARSPRMAALMALPAAMPLAVVLMFVAHGGAWSVEPRLLLLTALLAAGAALASGAWCALIEGRDRRGVYYGVTADRAIAVRGAYNGRAVSFDLATLSQIRFARLGRWYGDVVFAPTGGWPAGHAVLSGWGPPDQAGFRAVREPGVVAAVLHRARSAARRKREGRETLRAAAAAGGGWAEHVLTAELEEGEELLWAAGVERLPRFVAWDALTGGWTVCVALVALGRLLRAGAPAPPSWAVVALHLCALAPVYWLAGRFPVARLLRAGAAHGVTTGRVVTVTGFPRRRVTSTGLGEVSDLVLAADADGRGSVAFGWPGARRSRRPWGERWLYRPRPGGLAGLPDAGAVYDLIRRARADALRERDSEEGDGEAAGER
jgi:hypothetical protein